MPDVGGLLDLARGGDEDGAVPHEERPMSADERRVEEIIRHVERMRGSTWVSEDKQLMDECAWMDKAIRDLLAHIDALTARLAEAHAALAVAEEALDFSTGALIDAVDDHLDQ